ncbi:hypothetical protein GH714_040460 [Hevea brasiliensis]|uniref:Uncharacterized protein n=1 Tax=Hevea brasiliensis TaxID=3981 RepID=A0A6A6N9Y4_HEVBR|nr:hypothetical protein GH714_040456 [Hevea brasiliensis]KAF2321369.1 hypothetical protein GH714_040460 [Hevea brasiliensis]
MVDLLSRAEILGDAYAIIKVMPMRPDIIIWRALLSAYRTYKKLELVEVAITDISRLKSGDYVLLSNVYYSQKRWPNGIVQKSAYSYLSMPISNGYIFGINSFLHFKYFRNIAKALWISKSRARRNLLSVKSCSTDIRR